MTDEKADDEFRAHILGCAQLLTFTIALCLLAIAYYSEQPTQERHMEKTKYEMKAEVETASVLPKTLQAETQIMPFAGATIPMYPVYGRTDDDRKVWCATFIDSDEAMAWVQASRVYGRAVRGAVIAQQPGVTDGTGTDSREQAERPD